MNNSLNILLVEDQMADAELIESELNRDSARHTFRRVSQKDELLAALQELPPDLVLADLLLPGFDGRQALQLIKEYRSEVPVIFVSGQIGESDAIDLLKLGATDYVLKNDLTRLNPAIKRAMDEMHRERERRHSEEKYRNIFEKAVIGIFQHDRDRYLSVNPHFAHLHGYDTPAEMLEDISDIESQIFVRPADFARVRSIIAEKNFVENFEVEHHRKDGGTIWLSVDARKVFAESGEVLFYEGFAQNVTERKKAESDLDTAQARLLKSSRFAGMAEVATNVLHNVGNVLNSVYVSTSQITERLGNSPHEQVAEVTRLLRGHEDDLPNFVATERRGEQLINYLEQLAENLHQQHIVISAEILSLVKKIEHIDAVIATQQRYATMAGLIETVNLSELLDDALRMNAAGLLRHGVEIERDYAPVPPLSVERHKVLQILINLISNAKYAFQNFEGHRRLSLRIQPLREGYISIAVEDNAVGIPPENFPHIFEHGFTTRAGGHGFGLHSSALAAKELGGSLSASSAGMNLGATFVLEIPMVQAGKDFEPTADE